MSKIIILQGPPASGKSTEVKKWQAEQPNTRVIVSRDALRHARGQYWVPEQEEFITKLETYMVRQALEQGYDVAIDATNLNEAVLERWRQIALGFDAEVEAWLFHVEKYECFLKDSNADREHSVGMAVIESFYSKYEALCEAKGIVPEYGTITKYNPFQ